MQDYEDDDAVVKVKPERLSLGPGMFSDTSGVKGTISDETEEIVYRGKGVKRFSTRVARRARQSSNDDSVDAIKSMSNSSSSSQIVGEKPRQHRRVNNLVSRAGRPGACRSVTYVVETRLNDSQGRWVVRKQLDQYGMRI